MKLANPVTITPPAIKKPDGSEKTFDSITLTDLDVTIIDSARRKSVMVQIRPCPRPLVIWEKEAYDTAGDYTQAAVESRVLELLGSDAKSVLESLFVPQVPPLPQK